MINKIIDGISIALNAEFGDAYKIYTENVEQGLKEPCFSIVCVSPNNRQFMGKKYFRQNKFCVHFFPSSDEKVAECMDVLDRLYDCLEIIKVDGEETLGTKMTGEMDSGVLSFLVNYDMFMIKVDEQTNMENLHISQSMKG
jgi:hypothetical protein